MTVRCPECGTINSGQSKYCSACGHQVRPQTAGRCPECGAQNPANNIFCDECGHRLVPVDPALGSRTAEGSVRGLSLPRKEDASEDGVPDWLTRLRASFDEESDHGAESDTPARADSGAAQPPGLGPADEDTPSWLDDLADLRAPAPAEEDDQSPAGLPESRSELPDWLQQAMATPPPTAVSPSAVGAVREPPAGEPPAAEPPPGEPPAATPDEHMVEGTPPEQELDLPEPDGDLDPPPTAPVVSTPPTELQDMEPEELAGWLANLSEEPAMAELAATEPDEIGQLPDWLQSVALESGAIEADEDLGFEDAGLPDWLQALDLEETETTDAEEPPDWLPGLSVEEEQDHDARTELAQPEALAPEQPKTQAPESIRRPQKRPPRTGPLVPDELKEWLGETIGEDDQEPPPPGTAVKGTGKLAGTGPLVPPELPDWLAAVEDVPSTGELPGWLLQADKEVVEEEQARQAPPADRPKTAPLPSWLQADLDAIPVEDETEAVPGEIPDWLQPPPDMVDTGLARAELPSWLLPPEHSEMAAPDPDLLEVLPAWPEEAASASEGEPTSLAEAIIPDWLQALRPAEDAALEPGLPAGELEAVETEGFLAGVRGALPIEGAVITLPETRPLPKFVVTEQQHDHVKVLEQIIHGGPTPQPAPPPARPPQWWLERGLIPILILVAVFVPALLGYIDQPLVLPAAAQIRVEVSDVYAQIEGLTENATVVVAFDYSPAAAGELDLVATPLIRHLMARQARILAISTVPAGPQLAYTRLTELASEHEGQSGFAYQYGRDYLVLGYIPGGAVGLQAFATAPWELFSGADYLGRGRAETEGRDPRARNHEAAAGLVDSLVEAQLILLLTASRDDLVGWMEQVGRLPGMDQVPIVGGLSAGLEPWARPYYETDSEQLSGLVTGVPAAAEYAQLVDPQTAGTVALLRQSQTVGLVVVAVFVVIGLIWGSISGLSSRRRGNG
jgi:hypothetical protein